MNITKVRAVTKKRVAVDNNLEKIKARHTRERARELRTRFLGAFRRAVELASANGENQAIIEGIWSKDTDTFGEILKKEFKAFEASWLLDDSKLRPQSQNEFPKCYTIRIEW